jgi:hypothetical protein
MGSLPDMAISDYTFILALQMVQQLQRNTQELVAKLYIDKHTR